MNAKILSLTSFAASCLITAGTWCLLWPQRKIETPAQEPMESAHPAPDAKRIAALITEINTATSNQARLHAAEQLADLPLEAFPAAFDSVPLFEGRELTRAGKMLLIQWASMDGAAAAQWSWMQLRGEGLWSYAFKEIAASWAWHDPAGLCAWTLEQMKGYKPGSDSLSLEEALRTASPKLESGDIDKAARALVKEEPGLAYSLMVAKGSQWSHDNMAMDIDSPEGIRDALLAFEKVEIKRMEDGDLVLQLLKRWQELDPEDFARSPHANLLEETPGSKPLHQVITADGWKDLPPGERSSGAMAKIESYKGSARQKAASVIASSWAKMDHTACWTWVESLPEEIQAPAAAGYAGMNAAFHLEETLKRIEQLPVAAQSRALVAAYGTWVSRNSGAPENLDHWSTERRQAWQDLDALRQAQAD